jgi:hypothetical protein
VRPKHNCDYNIKVNVGRKMVLGCGLDSSDIGHMPVAGSYGHGNEICVL